MNWQKMNWITLLSSCFAAAGCVVAPVGRTPSPIAEAPAERRECSDAGTQRGIEECAGQHARQAEARLTALLGELGEVLDRTDIERLVDVQSKWSAYRAAHCEAQAGFFEGGSIRATIASACMASVTWNRIDELKWNLCEGQGMTGECEASKRYDRPAR